ncbi:MAG: hypothetical protein GXY33_10240 [Phycisphaerae bacterium]|nr:hypothetical protein [Phycisphaerae bacterium]
MSLDRICVPRKQSVARLWRDRRQSRRRSTIGAVNLAPMMDIMFNLLIFFLVASSFKLPEALLAARVPRTTGLSAEAAMPLVPVRIFLDAGEEGRPASIRLSTAMTADGGSQILVSDYRDLARRLADLRAQPGITDKTPVIIAARSATAWDHVVNTYNAALKAEFTRITFAEWK